MFSDEDVQDVFRLMPPGKAPLSSLGDLSNGLPSLLLSSTGAGLVTSSHISHRFERLADSGS